MRKKEVVSVSMDAELKENAEKVFAERGISAKQAIALFYKQVAVQRELPFRVPNEETIRTFEASDKGKDVVLCEDSEDMFKRLGI